MEKPKNLRCFSVNAPISHLENSKDNQVRSFGYEMVRLKFVAGIANNYFRKPSKTYIKHNVLINSL